MRTKFFIGTVLMVVAVVVLAITTTHGMVGTKKSALIYLQRPTQIAGKIVSGTVIFAHDDDRMMRGESCTTVYQYERGGRGKMLVEFMCIPSQAETVSKFTAKCTRALRGGPDILNEYQFAGDNEAHGVPWR